MSDSNLRQFDLNLLVALETLLEERSVTRAAQRLGLTQPATSRVLARLRVMFEDDLLVQVGRTMTPTPRGLALLAPLKRVLQETRELVRPDHFDPKMALGDVRIHATDAATESVVTPWIREIAQHAPRLRFSVEPVGAGTLASLLRGEADFSIDVYPDRIEGYHSTDLLFDHFVCVARSEHPAISSGLSPDVYSSLDHIQVIGTGGGGDILERELTRLGVERRIVLSMPSMASAPYVASQTDWLLTIPRMRARISQARYPIEIFPLPYAVREIPLSLLWPERVHSSPLHKWMRERLAALCLEATYSAETRTDT